MSKFTYELAYEPRERLGKGASRRLRRCEQSVLGIIYGGEEKAEPISLLRFKVAKALEHDGIFSHILTLTHNGKKQKVVLKDIQRHPYKPVIMHMDFMRINENKAITLHVPVHFPGQASAPGVIAGGIVTHHMVEIEIKCLPRDLPEYLEVDLSQAEIDHVVHLSQISLPKGVELKTPVHGAEDDLPVVSVHLPKLVVEPESVEATAATEVPAINVAAEDKKK